MRSTISGSAWRSMANSVLGEGTAGAGGAASIPSIAVRAASRSSGSPERIRALPAVSTLRRGTALASTSFAWSGLIWRSVTTSVFPSSATAFCTSAGGPTTYVLPICATERPATAATCRIATSAVRSRRLIETFPVVPGVIRVSTPVCAEIAASASRAGTSAKLSEMRAFGSGVLRCANGGSSWRVRGVSAALPAPDWGADPAAVPRAGLLLLPLREVVGACGFVCLDALLPVVRPFGFDDRAGGR